jgi:acyl-coenzyme A synthetase/AMP-(fatty) acid ligase
MCRHPAVAIAAAIGQPDAHAGEVPICVAVLREGAAANEAELLEFAVGPSRKFTVPPSTPTAFRQKLPWHRSRVVARV